MRSDIFAALGLGGHRPNTSLERFSNDNGESSLRSIAEDTSLGLRTVRAVVNQQDGTDRTTIKRLDAAIPTGRASEDGRPSLDTTVCVAAQIKYTVAKRS